MIRRLRAARRREERGAVAVLVAVVMSLALLGVTAFAVDIGMKRAASRDMQALSDIVALDVARLVDGRTSSEIVTGDGNRPSLQSALEDSVERNDTKTIGAGQACRSGGDAAVSADGISCVRAYLVDLFALPDADGFLYPHTGDVPVSVLPAERPDGVVVISGTTVAYVFGMAAQGTTYRDAVARGTSGGNPNCAPSDPSCQPPQTNGNACFTVGSYLASVNSAQSALLNPILSALFGSAINLDAVSYQGLANAKVALLDLVDLGGLNVGTVDELLALENLTARELISAAATVLDARGSSAQATILRDVAKASTTAGTPSVDIPDLISAAPGNTAALTASIDALSLLTGVAYVANQQNFVAVPGLNLDVPGVTAVNSEIYVIEAPRMGCGPVGVAEANTAQIRLRITAQMPAIQRTIEVLGNPLELDAPAAPVSIDIDLGQALGRLSAVTCTTSSIADSINVALSSSVVGSVTLNATLQATGKLVVPLLGSNGLLEQVLQVLNLGSLVNPPEILLDTGLSLYSSMPPPSPYTGKDVFLPLPASYTTPAGMGSGAILNGWDTQTTGTTTLQIKTTGLLGDTDLTAVASGSQLYSTVLNPVLSGVSSALAGIVTELQSDVIDPLAATLGIQIGGARVLAEKTPNCGSPTLVN